MKENRLRAKLVSIVLILFVSISIVLEKARCLEQEPERARDKPESEMSPEEKQARKEIQNAILHGKRTPADNAAEDLKREITFAKHSEALPAQEAREEREKSESEKTPEEKAIDKGIKDFVEGKSLLLPSDHQYRSARRLTASINRDTPPTTFVTFEKPSGFSRTIKFKNSYWPTTFSVHDNLDGDLARQCYDRGDVFVLGGYVTLSDEAWFKSNKLPYVIFSSESPKTTTDELIRAAALTIRPFEPGDAIILNALPSEVGGVRGGLELKRMGLSSTPDKWQDAKKQIIEAAGSTTIIPATKESVSTELSEGTKNVLFLMAHSDSQSIYLPGLKGGKLSYRDLESIVRDVAPNRAIVLLACRAGKDRGEQRSLAKLFLKNRLATAVLASDGDVYATSIAGVLRTLLRDKGNLNQSFGDLRTIVMDLSGIVGMVKKG